jgi:hypothetical protein
MDKSYKSQVSCLLCALVMLVFSTTSLAAGWSCTHGQSGNIEKINNVQTLDRVHLGWGLDFNQKPGLDNWVHFAPPTIHNSVARFIAIQFWLGSIDADVNAIHVYNLGAKIGEFELADQASGWHTSVFDLGSDIPVSAVNVSVNIGAGVESMSHRFVFTGACVYLGP